MIFSWRERWVFMGFRGFFETQSFVGVLEASFFLDFLWGCEVRCKG